MNLKFFMSNFKNRLKYLMSKSTDVKKKKIFSVVKVNVKDEGYINIILHWSHWKKKLLKHLNYHLFVQ